MTDEDEEVIRYVLNVAESKEQERAWEAFNRMLTEAEHAQDLYKAVREYRDALQAVHVYVHGYLNSGGNPTAMPKQWELLDRIREGKLKVMLTLVGDTQ